MFFLLHRREINLASRAISRRCLHDDRFTAGVDDDVVVVVDDDGRRMLQLVEQGRLEVADVIDDVVDDFHLGYFAVLRHVGHQIAKLAQVHLDLDLLVIGMLADLAVQHGRGGRHWFADGCGSLHHFCRKCC